MTRHRRNRSPWNAALPFLACVPLLGCAPPLPDSPGEVAERSRAMDPESAYRLLGLAPLDGPGPQQELRPPVSLFVLCQDGEQALAFLPGVGMAGLRARLAVSIGGRPLGRFEARAAPQQGWLVRDTAAALAVARARETVTVALEHPFYMGGVGRGFRPAEPARSAGYLADCAGQPWAGG